MTVVVKIGGLSPGRDPGSWISRARLPARSLDPILFYFFYRGLLPPGPPPLLIWGIYKLEKEYYMERTVNHFLEYSSNMDRTVHFLGI